MSRFEYVPRKLKRQNVCRQVNCPEIPLEIFLENDLEHDENFDICEYFSYVTLATNRLSIYPKNRRYAPIFMFLSNLSAEEYRDIVLKVLNFLEFLKLKYGIVNEV